MGLTLVPDTDPLSKRDCDMLNRAVEIAKQSTVRHRHGAVIYKSGRVLAVGINSIRNEHPTMEIDKSAYTYHAEAAAIRGIPISNDLIHGSTLYVARLNRRGNAMNSMPCEGCTWLLTASGIKRVVFTT